eukprot:TRINITY_DN25048_c0_g1_i1.p1 TRINITY_DN25048_c0_g1~~TRINITY_DN25048_c0_g1_i1.p1  ORF type:complete len:220 (+),score=11.22 TRINITY_DN25048_c0_g1_i1:77-736(+)
MAKRMTLSEQMRAIKVPLPTAGGTTKKRKAMPVLKNKVIDILSFVLPKGVYYPRSTERLLLYANLGPLVTLNGKFGLRAGPGGKEVASDPVVTNLIREEGRKLVIESHSASKHQTLTLAEQEEVLMRAQQSGVSSKLDSMTEDEILTLLQQAGIDDFGEVEFHAVAHVVGEERRRLLASTRSSFPPLPGQEVSTTTQRVRGVSKNGSLHRTRDRETMMF